MSPTKSPTNVQTEAHNDPLAVMKRRMDQLEAENAALKAQKTQGISLKVSELGAISVYGMGRFPTTLYRPQWEALLAKGGEFTAFIKANEPKLSTGKDDPRFLAVRAKRAEAAAAEAAKAESGATASAPKGGSAV